MFARFSLFTSLLFSWSASTAPRFLEIFLWTLEKDLGMMSALVPRSNTIWSDQRLTCSRSENFVFFSLLVRQNQQAVNSTLPTAPFRPITARLPKAGGLHRVCASSWTRKQQQLTFQRRRPGYSVELSWLECVLGIRFGCCFVSFFSIKVYLGCSRASHTLLPSARSRPMVLAL